VSDGAASILAKIAWQVHGKTVPQARKACL